MAVSKWKRERDKNEKAAVVSLIAESYKRWFRGGFKNGTGTRKNGTKFLSSKIKEHSSRRPRRVVGQKFDFFTKIRKFDFFTKIKFLVADQF